MTLSPKEAKLILADGGLQTLVQACEECPEDDAVEYLNEVAAALRILILDLKHRAKGRAK